MSKGIPKSGFNKGWFTTERMKGDKNPSKRSDVREKISKANLGRVISEDSKIKISKTLTGRKQDNNIILKRLKHPNIQKVLFKKGNKLGELTKGIFRGGYQAKHEKEILDFIEPSIGFPIIRQFVINRKIVDGYCPQRNIVFEVDEKHHYKFGKLRDKDLQRQKEIENELNCMFIRIRI